MKVKCVCGAPECPEEIRVEFESGQALITMIGKDREESLLYLDANGMVEMIRDLKRGLIEMTRILGE